MHPGRGKSPVRRHGGVRSGKSPYARDGSKSDSIGKVSFPLTDLRVFLRIYVFSDFFMLFSRITAKSFCFNKLPESRHASHVLVQ
jgi:hypothetical protein